MAFIGNMNQYDYVQRDVLANILEAFGLIGPQEVKAEHRELFGPHYAPYWYKDIKGEIAGGGDDKYQAVGLLIRLYEAEFLRDEAVSAGIIPSDERDTYWGHISDELTSLQRTLAGLEVESSIHAQERFRRNLDSFFDGLQTVTMEMNLLSQRKSGRRNIRISEEHRVSMIEKATRHIGDAEAALKWLKEKVLDEEHPPSMADIDAIDGLSRGLAEVLLSFWSIMGAKTTKIPDKVG